MDETVKLLFGLLPVAWQPYVILLLLVLYVTTKWRSNIKTRRNKEVWATRPLVPHIGFFERVLDFLC